MQLVDAGVSHGNAERAERPGESPLATAGADRVKDQPAEDEVLRKVCGLPDRFMQHEYRAFGGARKQPLQEGWYDARGLGR